MPVPMIVAALALLTPSAAYAQDDGVPQCKLAQPVKYYDRLGDLPKPLQEAVRAQTGDIAEAGAPYNATDVRTEGLPSRRFIRAGQSGDSWFVWFEHGGMVYNVQTLGYIWIIIPGHPEDTAPRLTAHFVLEPCTAASAFLDGVMTSPPVQ
jgi:hypothetical protein